MHIKLTTPQSILFFTSLLMTALANADGHLADEKHAIVLNGEGIIELSPSNELMRAHMSILAADDMEGREAGTPGYDRAAAYVAAQFRDLGLEPGGNDGAYFQEVQLRKSVRDVSKVSMEVRDAQGRVIEFKSGVDYHVRGSLLSAKSDVTAEVVFVGYGLVAPELGRDDYEGVDVEGKLVMVLAGTPDGIQSEERAFYGSRKGEEASKRGALGVISLATPISEKIFPFERIAKQGIFDKASMGWIKANGQIYSRARNLKVGAVLSPAGVEKMFAHAPASWVEVLEASTQGGGELSNFAMPLTVRIQQASILSDTRSDNVLGVVSGSDPELINEVLVLSAHLDGLGVSTTDEEDRINNGALDNAAGIATLLETARMLMERDRPRRTVVFLANTAEEKGLLGSQYYALNPTVGDKEIVANINLDMPVLTYDFQDVVVFGGDRSTLRGVIQSAAKEMGLTLAKDPFPEQGIFTRSDHFMFVETGVPSVMLATGMANGGKEAWAEHFAEHYHRPSDDMDNKIDFDAAARFAELKTRITMRVANLDERPLWKKGDFFGRQFNGATVK